MKGLPGLRGFSRKTLWPPAGRRRRAQPRPQQQANCISASHSSARTRGQAACGTAGGLLPTGMLGLPGAPPSAGFSRGPALPSPPAYLPLRKDGSAPRRDVAGLLLFRDSPPGFVPCWLPRPPPCLPSLPGLMGAPGRGPSAQESRPPLPRPPPRGWWTSVRGPTGTSGSPAWAESGEGWGWGSTGWGPCRRPQLPFLALGSLWAPFVSSFSPRSTGLSLLWAFPVEERPGGGRGCWPHPQPLLGPSQTGLRGG